MKKLLADVAALVGLGMVGYGLWLIWPPVMWVVVGVSVAAGAVWSAK